MRARILRSASQPRTSPHRTLLLIASLTVLGWISSAWASTQAPTDLSGANPSACQMDVQLRTHSGTAVPDGVIVRIWADGKMQARQVVERGRQLLRFADLPCRPWTLGVGDQTGFGFDKSWEQFQHEPADGPVWNVAMHAVQAVVIKRVNASGAAVPGSLVAVLSIWDHPDNRFGGATAMLDTNGQGRLLLHEGNYELRVPSDPPAESVQIDGTEVGVDRPIFSVSTNPVEVRIVAGNSLQVHGRVVDSRGEGVGSIGISAFAPDWSSWGDVRTDPSGYFSVLVKQLPVSIVPIATEAAFQFHPGVVEVTAADEFVEFRAEPGELDLRGSVVEAETRNPVPRATFKLELVFQECAGEFAEEDLATLPPFFDRHADEQGRFSARCVPGCPLEVTVGWPADGPDRRASARSTHRLSEAECTGEHVFTLKRGATLAGTVSDRKGLPLADFPLEYGHARLRTDSDGRFELTHLADEVRTLVMNRRGVVPKPWKGWVLVRKDKDDRKPGPLKISTDDLESGEDLELVALPGGTLCANVSFGDESFDGLKKLELFDSEQKNSVYKRSMPKARAQPNRLRLCSESVPPADYLVLLSGSFPPNWQPGVSSRSEAVPVRVESGKTVELPTADLSPTGTVKVQTPGWPHLDDPEFVPVFEYAAAPPRPADEPEFDAEGRPTELETPELNETDTQTLDDAPRVEYTALSPDSVANPKYRRENDPELWRKDPVFQLNYFPPGRWLLRACVSATACTAGTTLVELETPFEVGPGQTTKLDLPYPAPLSDAEHGDSSTPDDASDPERSEAPDSADSQHGDPGSPNAPASLTISTGLPHVGLPVAPLRPADPTKPHGQLAVRSAPVESTPKLPAIGVSTRFM